MPRSEAEAGFSLLEVVVALTILSAGLVAVQTIHAAAARGERMAADRLAALAAAESLLAETLAADRLGPDLSEGRTAQGISWRREIQPAGMPTQAGLGLWRVTVETLPAGSARPVALETVAALPAERTP